jgi:hypothetical protein
MASLKLIRAVAAALTPALVTLLPYHAAAQVLEGIEIEGPITADPTANSITVMGIVVTVPSGKLSTPTNPSVDLTDLTAALPGRSRGFVGGTAIIEGTSTGGQVTANPELGSVFSDVSENVVVGEATDPDGNPATLHVNDLALRALDDVRIPADPPHDGFGFEIRPETIEVGSLLSVEGYLDEQGGTLHWHDLESDNAALVRPTEHEVSILRARCRKEGEELELRGGAHLPLPPTTVAIGRVRVTALDQTGATVAGPFTVPVTPVTEQAGFGRWRLSADDLSVAQCRATVRAQLLPPLAGETELARAEKKLEVR